MNIRLKDVVVDFILGGADDGALNAGTEYPDVCIDDFSFDGDEGLIDVTCGQADIKTYRQGQYDWTASFTFKIDSAYLTPTTGMLTNIMSASNPLLRVQMGIAAGNLQLDGIRKVTLNGGDAPTATIELRSYGVNPTFS